MTIYLYEFVHVYLHGFMVPAHSFAYTQMYECGRIEIRVYRVCVRNVTAKRKIKIIYRNVLLMASN